MLNREEAKLVRHIFKRFTEIGSPLTIAEELNQKGITTKSWMTKKGTFRQGHAWNRTDIYRVLYNRTYLGEVNHQGTAYRGEHDAIITKELWERAHAVIENNKSHRSTHVRAKAPALLKGIIRCGACDSAMSPVSAQSKGKLYRYYTCGKASREGHDTCPVKSVPAGEIEGAVIHQLRSIFQAPEMIAQSFQAARELEAEDLGHLRAERTELETHLTEPKETASRLMNSGDADSRTAEEIRRINDQFVETQRRLHDVSEDIQGMQARLISERDIVKSLRGLDPIWEELYPLEQCRIIQLLVEQVTVNPDGLSIKIRANGVHSLVTELKETTATHEERRCAV